MRLTVCFLRLFAFSLCADKTRYRTRCLWWNVTQVTLLPPARSELRKVLFWRCLWLFRLCMKYLGNRWTDLHQIHREGVFGPSLGWVWMSRSKVKVTTDKKRGFQRISLNRWTDLRQIDTEDVLGLSSLGRVWRSSSTSAACVRFLFGKTSLL